jgi:hypothetical protein
MEGGDESKLVQPMVQSMVQPMAKPNNFGPQGPPPKAAVDQLQDMVDTQAISARLLFGTVVGGLCGLSFGVMEAANQVKQADLKYNSRAALNMGIDVTARQGVWFAGYYATFQVFKYSVCKAVGNTNPSTTAAVTAVTFLPLASVRAWRPYVPCALMLCALDFYHEHKVWLGFG